MQVRERVHGTYTQKSLDSILALGYNRIMDKDSLAISNAARLLGKRSAQARIEKWGRKEFIRKMREWGARGGRPRKKGASDERISPR